MKILLVVMCLLLVPIHTFGACIYLDDPKASIEAVVKNTVRGADAVFTGKVLRFEYREGYRSLTFELLNQSGIETPRSWRNKVAIVKVDRWWKMAMPQEVIVVTDETMDPAGRLSGGEDFYHFSEGESYLIYASGTLKELRGQDCSRTVPLSRASADLAVLGPGNLPFTLTAQATSE